MSPDSSTGHRITFRDQIWWKSAVAKLPKDRVDSHTKKTPAPRHLSVGVRGHFVYLFWTSPCICIDLLIDVRFSSMLLRVAIAALVILDIATDSVSECCKGSASTVLTATGQVNGRWQILTPHRIKTHEPTATKFRTIDYVREGTP